MYGVVCFLFLFGIGLGFGDGAVGVLGLDYGVVDTLGGKADVKDNGGLVIWSCLDGRRTTN